MYVVGTFVFHISREPFIQSTSHLVGVLLGTQGCAASHLVRFGHAILINFE